MSEYELIVILQDFTNSVLFLKPRDDSDKASKERLDLLIKEWGETMDKLHAIDINLCDEYLS